MSDCSSLLPRKFYGNTSGLPLQEFFEVPDFTSLNKYFDVSTLNLSLIALARQNCETQSSKTSKRVYFTLLRKVQTYEQV